MPNLWPHLYYRKYVSDIQNAKQVVLLHILFSSCYNSLTKINSIFIVKSCLTFNLLTEEWRVKATTSTRILVLVLQGFKPTWNPSLMEESPLVTRKTQWECARIPSFHWMRREGRWGRDWASAQSAGPGSSGDTSMPSRSIWSTESTPR